MLEVRHPKRRLGYGWLYSLILLICLAMALSSAPSSAAREATAGGGIAAGGEEDFSAAQPNGLPQGIVVGMPPVATEPWICSAQELWAGKLLLIDGSHPIPYQAPPPNTLSVAAGGAAARSSQTVAAQEVTAALKDWFAAARQKGFGSPVVWAGTRSKAQQLDWQLEQLRLYAQDCSLLEAAQRTAREREAPGCSEHQTGYAVDIRLCEGYNQPPDDQPLSHSAPGQYLLATAWRYGFIHRYNEKDPPLCPEEAYHFRYVGVAHARMMALLEKSFPDYLAFLREHRAVCYYEGGALRTLILCEEVSGDWRLNRPQGAAQAQVSMDNTGYAVALFTFDPNPPPA